MKKIIWSIVIISVLGLAGYLTKGAADYFGWLKSKEAIADGGFTNLYAGTFGSITPGCTYTTAGCTCTFCNTCGCNTYDQALISVGQEVNKGAMYLCVSNALQVKGSPLIASANKQFMAGSITGQCLTPNAVLATPSLAANHFERLAKFIDNFIIAGKKIIINE